eukprot:6667321-Prymnesium_polylepis.3
MADLQANFVILLQLAVPPAVSHLQLLLQLAVPPAVSHLQLACLRAVASLDCSFTPIADVIETHEDDAKGSSHTAEYHNGAIFALTTGWR